MSGLPLELTGIEDIASFKITFEAF